MMYSEFDELTGADCGAAYYHKNIEPGYYDYPGNKQEFCRDWLVGELAKLSKKLVDFQSRVHKIEEGTAEGIDWIITQLQFAEYTEKLVKINKWLGYI